MRGFGRGQPRWLNAGSPGRHLDCRESGHGGRGRLWDAVIVARGLTEAAEDLQELYRGIHPAILSKGGLGAGVSRARLPFADRRHGGHRDGHAAPRSDQGRGVLRCVGGAGERGEARADASVIELSLASRNGSLEPTASRGSADRSRSKATSLCLRSQALGLEGQLPESGTRRLE
jgi:hypothetical protein